MAAPFLVALDQATRTVAARVRGELPVGGSHRGGGIGERRRLRLLLQPFRKGFAGREFAAFLAERLSVHLVRPDRKDDLADATDGSCPADDFTACLYSSSLVAGCFPRSSARIPLITLAWPPASSRSSPAGAFRLRPWPIT
ncbi:hypothetical protein AB0D04_38355 [Streptomyces sp. NPDC048483]|uniref:hypothetical protein n=1 Tax=Streptomyces sp. NPDC048483 TaxID=3154927 RepID=UPI003418767B